ncbi:MAG TPA: hypothetical protein VEZ59_02335 [Sphingopyxis sp.]|nr:hypothetical protein [Sphingopyxis sp.]
MSDTLYSKELGRSLYADLMNEARDRLNAIQQAIDRRDQCRPIITQEFCYIQLRALCEVIAIGCIIAHGDRLDKDTLKAPEASVIMKRLGKFSPNFYPRPVRVQITGMSINLEDNTEPFLTKDELSILWGKAGNFVHRGSARNLLRAKTAGPTVNLDEIIAWGMKIKNLLEIHLISSTDKKEHLLVHLSHEQAGGGALVSIANSPLKDDITRTT